MCVCGCVSCSVVFNSATHRLQHARLLCPWNSPGKYTGVGLPFPSSRDLPDPGIKPESPALQADSSPSELQEDQQYIHRSKKGNRYLSTDAGRPVAVVVAVDILFSAK